MECEGLVVEGAGDGLESEAARVLATPRLRSGIVVSTGREGRL
jgi:hypothetical protein